jgi:hypothetical protein
MLSAATPVVTCLSIVGVRGNNFFAQSDTIHRQRRAAGGLRTPMLILVLMSCIIVEEGPCLIHMNVRVQIRAFLIQRGPTHDAWKWLTVFGNASNVVDSL